MRIILAALLWLCCFSAKADWQTIKTQHFNVHFPAALSQWAYSAATELEVVRTQVLAQQNRALPGRADVIIYDPSNLANGFALPSSDNPMMALQVTPPQADSMIANHSSWQQLLILHEYIHLVHMSQPSRHAWRQRWRDLYDISDLLDAVLPRWVSEGYATLLESRLTGRGRLYDNYSESVVRYYAQQGALPSYAALSNDNQEYLSGSMAYLVGVRFLAWLEDNYGEQTLDAVWTRAQAVKERSFEQAFRGAFAASAKTLYRRFVAEYTYAAMQQEQEDSSELWQQFSFAATDIALAPSANKFLVVERDKKGYMALNVYSNAANPEAIKRFEEGNQALLAADPDDIADAAPKVFAKKRLATLDARNYGGIYHPQWLDEDSVYFVAKTPQSDQAYINDLFVWHIETGETKRLTQHMGVRRFTIVDKDTLIAEVSRQGLSQLERIDLAQQTSSRILDSQLGDVFDFPVLSQSQATLAFAKVSPNQRWQVFLYDMASQQLESIQLPAEYQYIASLNWSYDGDWLYFISGRDGHLRILRYAPKGRVLQQLAPSNKPLQQVWVNPDEQLFARYATPSGVKVDKLDNANWTRLDDVVHHQAELQKALHPHRLPAASIDLSAKQKQPCSVLPQATSLALGAAFNSASFASVSLALKGQDVLQQLAWQVGAEQSISNSALAAGYGQLSYRQGQWQSQLNVAYQDWQVDKQAGADNVATHHRFNRQQASLLSAYRFGDPLAFITPTLGVHHVVRDSAQWSGLSYGVDGGWLSDTKLHGAAINWSASQWLGELQGYSYQVNARLKLWQVALYGQVQQRYSRDMPLSLGGGITTSSDLPASFDTVSAPELPHFFQSGQRYLGYQFATSWRQGQPQLYYKQHQLDGTVVAQSYGVKWSMRLSERILGKAVHFAPAGLTDLRVSMGAARVEGRELTAENRAWFSLWYQL